MNKIIIAIDGFLPAEKVQWQKIWLKKSVIYI